MSMPGVLKSRISLFEENCVLIDSAVVLNNFHLSTNTKVINVSNPVDEINYYLYQKLNLNKENIYGIGLSHDFARIINELGYENIEIRGKHGEDIEIYKEDIKIEVDYENRSRGMRILELKKGIPPVFAPVASIMSLLNAFILKKEILTYASVWCRETEGFTGKKIKISYCSQALKHE
jgi:malate/lactate dehydrogenase